MESSRPAATTEITVLGGERYRVEGTTQGVERAILKPTRRCESTELRARSGAALPPPWILIEIDR